MRRLFAVLALAAAVTIPGCRAPVRPYACAIDPEQVDVDVHAVWICNRDVLDRAARGKPFSIRELRSASRFFEQLTGLRVDTRASHLGALPGEELLEDLETLDVWYLMHASRLRWDLPTGRVVFGGLASGGGPV